MLDAGNNIGINTGIYHLFTPQEIEATLNQINESPFSRGSDWAMLMEHVKYMAEKNMRIGQ